MALIVVLMPDSSLYKIPILLVLQTAYLVYSFAKRSFNEYTDQMVQVFNESVFLILIMLLIKYRSESDWTDTAENVFIGIILSQLSILMIVSMASGIIKIVRCCIKRCRKSSPIQAQNENLQTEHEIFNSMFILRNDRSTLSRRAVFRSSIIST